MMTAFFFYFNDQSEVGEGHEIKVLLVKVEVSISVILHITYIAS